MIQETAEPQGSRIFAVKAVFERVAQLAFAQRKQTKGKSQANVGV